MKIKANAKINASLNVVSRRNDGYHELEMVMLPLTLHDEISVEIADEDTYSWNLHHPIDEKNTMVKAVKLMRKTYGLTHKYKIHALKRIPMEAGLGGGTSDGAAVMKGIAQLENIKVSLEELSLLGKQIGADVPFGVINQPAIVKGIGEKIETFRFSNFFEVLLVKPKQGVSTKECFQRLDLTSCIHPDAEAVKEALLQKDFNQLVQVIGNTLEEPACQWTSEILEVKQALINEGFEGVCMSGSGSTVFALTQNSDKIQRFMNKYQSKDWFIEPCQIELSEKNNI